MMKNTTRPGARFFFIPDENALEAYEFKKWLDLMDVPSQQRRSLRWQE